MKIGSTLSPVVNNVRALIKQESWFEADEIIRTNLMHHADSIILRHLAATVALKMKDYELAKKHGETMLSIDPHCYLGYQAIAKSYVSRVRIYDSDSRRTLQCALAILDQGIERTPSSIQLENLRLFILNKLGRYSDVCDIASSLLMNGHSSAELYSYAANSCIQLGRVDDCLDILLKANTSFDHLPRSLQNIESDARLSKHTKSLIAPILESVLCAASLGSNPFDEIYSLGGDCLPASMISRLGKRSRAMPFDWILCPDHAVLQLLRTRFEGF